MAQALEDGSELACVEGRIKLVLFDDRRVRPPAVNSWNCSSGPDSYQLVQIPTDVWNGFVGLGAKVGITANCAAELHTDEFSGRIRPDDQRIPYAWAPR